MTQSGFESTPASRLAWYLSIETYIRESVFSIFGHVGQRGPQGRSRWGKGGIPKVFPLTPLRDFRPPLGSDLGSDLTTRYQCCLVFFLGFRGFGTRSHFLGAKAGVREEFLR